MASLDKRITIRVPVATHSRWQAAAEKRGLSLADFVRHQVSCNGESPDLSKRPTPAKIPQRLPAVVADPALLRELSRIGNNLNQIARFTNTHADTMEAVEIIAHLVAIERELKRCT